MDGDLALPSAQHAGCNNRSEGDEFGDRYVVATDNDFLAGRLDGSDELREVGLCLVDADSRRGSLVRPDQKVGAKTLGISWGSDWLEFLVTDDVQSLPDLAENEPVVYWRPGCGFCSMLRAGLQRHGISYREVNIWDDPDAAAFVRSVARGNETVPTVTVGSVSLVNPSVDEVAALLASVDS